MKYTVLGVNFFNKGAELMLCAIKQQIKEWDENNTIGCPIGTGGFKLRKEADLKHILCKSKRQELLKEKLALAVADFIPKEIRHQNNLFLESEIDVFLDASGFVFGDQWGSQKTRKMLELCTKWKRQHKKVILLPQAFGPFTDKETRAEFIKLIDYIDLAFARDIQSYKYISQLDISMERIKLAPDFTNLVKPQEPKYIDNLVGRPCIIPNQKMIDKTSKEVSQSYVPFLETTITYLQNKGLKPFVLLHEHKDRKISSLLQEKLLAKESIIQEENTLYLKGIINRCSFTIGSRFHGLVSALSQGIPSIGTGWSHKYQILFKDYECSNMLINPNSSQNQYLSKLNLLIDEQKRKELSDQLLLASEKQKEISRQMWLEVKNTIYNSSINYL